MRSFLLLSGGGLLIKCESGTQFKTFQKKSRRKNIKNWRKKLLSTKADRPRQKQKKITEKLSDNIKADVSAPLKHRKEITKIKTKMQNSEL